MKRAERKELNAALDALLADDGDHVGALERLCVLAGRKVQPIVQSGSVTVLEASADHSERTFMPPNTQSTPK